jgi:hypothetical protein
MGYREAVAYWLVLGLDGIDNKDSNGYNYIKYN